MKVLQYYPKESTQVVDKFRTLELPYPGWIRNDELKMSVKTNADKHGDFLNSLWAARAYKKDNPDEDLVEEVMKQINEVLVGQGKGMEFTVNWNLFILMGHKPMK
ncbi:hypothetical protein PoB_001012000 [Plakobranchus ocellatus]|uniref:Uncharacterized protein n=1 Tax=Plakobranchus ocellatus TaxID=259542 RepID=A0AAV3YKI2_9GAST|nr:hypothetical protein PoB_001012000 [Plakobranchus ocellatus]